MIYKTFAMKASTSGCWQGLARPAMRTYAYLLTRSGKQALYIKHPAFHYVAAKGWRRRGGSYNLKGPAFHYEAAKGWRRRGGAAII